MAHQLGYAREDEANFIAFVVCVHSDDSSVRYSGYLNALSIVSAILSDSPPERSREIYSSLGDGARADLRERNEFWSRYLGTASEVSHRVNDTYLRANRIESGARSYNEDVSLVISYYLSRRDNGVPD
jgi:hypothetical protein